jgi:hypothetical protein
MHAPLSPSLQAVTDSLQIEVLKKHLQMCVEGEVVGIATAGEEDAPYKGDWLHSNVIASFLLARLKLVVAVGYTALRIESGEADGDEWYLPAWAEWFLRLLDCQAATHGSVQVTKEVALAFLELIGEMDTLWLSN